MSRYQTGEETRTKILQTCRTLFYRHGFRAVTYKMRCAEADCNPGSINYHFGSKAGIAQEIYAQTLDDFTQKVQKALEPSIETLTAILVSFFLHIRLMYEDDAYRRFNREITCDCIDELRSNNYLETYSGSASQLLDSVLSEEKRLFYETTSAGFDMALNIFIDENYLTAPFRQTCSSAAELYFYLLGRDQVAACGQQALELVERITVSCSDMQVMVTQR